MPEEAKTASKPQEEKPQEAKSQEERRATLWMGIVAACMTLILMSALFVQWNRSDKVVKKFDEASLRLNWAPDPTFTGAYLAKARGLWEEQKLKVALKPGGIGLHLDPVRLVVDGTDTFGIVRAGRLLEAFNKGLPVVAISLELRDTSVGWIVREESGIKSFRQFRNKKVAYTLGTGSKEVLYAVLNRLRIARRQLTLVPVEFSLEPFLQKKVVAFPVDVNKAPYLTEIKVRTLHPSDIGLHLYGNVVITSEATIKNRPKLVQRFINGLLEGWNAAAQEKPEKIVKELVKVEKDMQKVFTQQALLATLQLVQGRKQKNTPPIGYMSLDGWQQTRQALHPKQKNIKIEKAFNNKFVEQYYKSKKE